MKRITLEVSQDLANKWKNSTKEQQARVTSIFRYALELVASANSVSIAPPVGYGRPTEKELTDHRDRTTQNLIKHFQEMDEISKKAMFRGLNLEILEDLLARK